MRYIVNRKYSTEELSNPSTYEDEMIARIVRHLVARKIDLPIGEAKKAVFRGEHPECVKDVLDDLYKEREALLDKLKKLQNNLTGSYTVSGPFLVDGDEYIHLDAGAFIDDLHTRLKRIKAIWDGVNLNNKKLWVIPLDSVGSVQRVITNHLKATKKKEEEEQKAYEESMASFHAKAALAKETSKPISMKLRPTNEDDEDDDLPPSAQINKPTPANPSRYNRRKVRVGQYYVGDQINGKTIGSFGSSWTEKQAPKEFFSVQLWEPCRCGEEPVYARGGLEHMGTQMCEKCTTETYGEPVEVCYAYFE